METSLMTTDDVVQEIMRLRRSLPARPGIDEVVAAKTLIRNVEREDQLGLEAIAKQSKGKDVPEELFKILQEIQISMIHFQSKEHSREALKLLDVESVHLVFDNLIQRASRCLPGASDSHYSDTVKTSYNGSPSSLNTSATTEIVKASEPLFTRDDMYVKKPKMGFNMDGLGFGSPAGDLLATTQIVDPTLKPVTASGQDGEKLSLIKLASLIEASVKKGTQKLVLQAKLSDQIKWLPDSIRKLSSLTTLDLSENRIAELPDAIGGLSSLEVLDLHANLISELPETIGDLLNLLNLDLRGNQLRSLPPTIDRLVRLQELDLSSNGLPSLPETIGSLVSLRVLNIEMNNIEEIPHTISRCVSLKELHADYNRLKALPEAVGRIESLEILTVRYNNIRQLPTTMSSLANLRELDVSFNELESVPESLCFATTLQKMNISNNFADLQYLPRSIGNLEMLEELDMSNNQIRVLPDSFRMLTQLRILKVDGNPLTVPPRDVIDKGPQAIVQFIAEFVAKKEVKSRPVKQKKSWAQICFFSRSNKRKRNAMGYDKT
ncbi:Plant intracellular Ras-group-related LRR protein 4 [Salvia divinorum]|uniref:Plant intracellular Ras-group-related LRR protein 4 n=1 Tax=Salvia divinorum TaxID=28513 RepID=A0ABD1IM63_SALDI